MGIIYCYVKEAVYSVVWFLKINKKCIEKVLDDVHIKMSYSLGNRIGGIFFYSMFSKFYKISMTF